MPSIVPERDWGARHGCALVAGVDEAGRGPLAGPVVAAAVVFDLARPRPRGLDDSKRLDAATRARLAAEIRRRAVAWAVAAATPEEIDALNILGATRLAARRALAALGVQPGAIVTDALSLPGESRPVLPIIRGDSKSASVAAASILAKTARDGEMDRWAVEFPGYGWESNRGYPTAAHYAALERLGPTTIHRLTFAGVGFFSTELRWSATGQALKGRIVGGAGLSAEEWEMAASLPAPEREWLVNHGRGGR